LDVAQRVDRDEIVTMAQSSHYSWTLSRDFNQHLPAIQRDRVMLASQRITTMAGERIRAAVIFGDFRIIGARGRKMALPPTVEGRQRKSPGQLVKPTNGDSSDLAENQ